MIRWSIMYFVVLYTCIFSGSACTWYANMLYFLWAWVCLPQTVFLSDLLLWLGKLNCGEVLLSFWQISFPCTFLIHFGHHVPLLTSYIMGHLLYLQISLLRFVMLHSWPRPTPPSRPGPKFKIQCFIPYTRHCPKLKVCICGSVYTQPTYMS